MKSCFELLLESVLATKERRSTCLTAVLAHIMLYDTVIFIADQRKPLRVIKISSNSHAATSPASKVSRVSNIKILNVERQKKKTTGLLLTVIDRSKRYLRFNRSLTDRYY